MKHKSLDLIFLSFLTYYTISFSFSIYWNSTVWGFWSKNEDNDKKYKLNNTLKKYKKQECLNCDKKTYFITNITSKNFSKANSCSRVRC